MKIVRIIFFLFMSAFSFSICLLASKVYSVAFGLSQSGADILNAFAIALPLIFIISMFFGLLDDDHYFKKLLYPINLFAGIMLYIFLSAVALSIVLLFASGISITLLTSIAIVSFSTACLLGIIGAIQAKRFKIVSYKVNMQNTPELWKNKKVVLVSDTHFGLINHKNFSDKIVKNILKLNPDLVLHAGDFYDGPKNNMSVITESWQELTKSVPVFFAPGNHEMYGDYEAFLSSIRDAGINVLTDSFIEHDGVQIAGITYRGKNQPEKASTALQSLGTNKDKPLILINHPPLFHDNAIEIHTDLMVSGHTHNGQLWPLNYVAKAMYKKYFYGMNKKQNLTAITTSGVGTYGPPIRLFNTPELVVINFTN